MTKRVKRPPRALWVVFNGDGDLDGEVSEKKRDAEQWVSNRDDWRPDLSPHYVIKYVVAPTKRGAP